MEAVAHLGGGAPVLKKYKIRANVGTSAFKGIPVINVTDSVGVGPATATSAADTAGLGIDQGTYSTTQGAAEGMVTVSIRPDLVVGALASGGAAEGTALAILTNTSASAGGTTISDATNVSANDMTGGLTWCIKGANVGAGTRTITTHTASTSIVVTVPFPNAIAVGDQFIMVPWNPIGTGAGGIDGNTAVQLTTNLTQARATIASGTGANVEVYDVLANSTLDSYVQFLLIDHVYGTDTV